MSYGQLIDAFAGQRLVGVNAGSAVAAGTGRGARPLRRSAGSCRGQGSGRSARSPASSHRTARWRRRRARRTPRARPRWAVPGRRKARAHPPDPCAPRCCSRHRPPPTRA